LSVFYDLIFNFILNIFRWGIDFLINLEGHEITLIKNIFWFFGVVFFIVIIYLLRKYYLLRKKEEDSYIEKVRSASEEADGKERNRRWEQVLNNLDSLNESEWRVGILEADAILDEMLDMLGYEGDTMAEKLKSVNQDGFATLQKAWEAHKIRNRIAHDGVSFVLTKREAQRVVALYRDVFTEFNYI